jgi:curved DNA-binding protein CbpA/Tfp pilus assembly protein PilF
MDYYAVLGLGANATAEEIRLAFKRMAMRYHPDKNKGNLAAEEQFKRINEAYQVLSDPVKKSHYDYSRWEALLQTTTPKETYHTKFQRKPYPYPPTRPFNPGYQFDARYFWGIFGALMFVIVLGALVTTAFSYLKIDKETLRQKEQHAQQLAKARKMFLQGQYALALVSIKNLDKEYPTHEPFARERESMTTEVGRLGKARLEAGDYIQAIALLQLALEHQRRQDLELLHHLAQAYKEINQWEKALATYEYVQVRDKDNLPVNLELARLLNQQDGREDQAMAYYDRVKQIILTQQLLNKGQVVLDNSTTYLSTLMTEMGTAKRQLGRPSEAIDDLSLALQLDPNSLSAYQERAEAYRDLGLRAKACEDFQHIEKMDSLLGKDLLKKHCR